MNAEDHLLSLQPVTGGDPVSRIGAAPVVISMLGNAVLKQPAADDRQAAADLATRATNDLLPELTRLTADLLLAANSWASFGPGLQQAASKSDWASVAQGLGMTAGDVASYRENARSASRAAGDLGEALAREVGVLREESTRLSREVPPQVAVLDTIAAAQSSLLGILSETLFAGASAAGVPVILATGQGQQALLADSADPGPVLESLVGQDAASKALRQATRRRARVGSESMAGSGHLCALSNLHDCVLRAASVAGTLAAAWTAYEKNRSLAVTELKQAGDDERSQLVEAIDAAVASWPRVGAVARAAQDQGANMSIVDVDLEKPGTSLLDSLSPETVRKVRAAETGLELMK